MRDVGVWKIVRSNSRAAGAVFMLSGCFCCINAFSVDALALPSLGTVQTLASDTTMTLEKAVTLPQKTAVSPTYAAAVSTTNTSPSTPEEHQSTTLPAKSSSPTPFSASASMSPASQPSALPRPDNEMIDDHHLMQPFILADTASWPYVSGWRANVTSQQATIRSAFIEATPQGWRIGGVLWYWWIGFVGLVAIAIHERIYFIPRHIRHGV